MYIWNIQNDGLVISLTNNEKEALTFDLKTIICECVLNISNNIKCCFVAVIVDMIRWRTIKSFECIK